MARGKKKVQKVTPPAAVETTEKPKTAYHEHLAAWESKADRLKAESSFRDSDFAKHPKFDKFKAAKGANR